MCLVDTKNSVIQLPIEDLVPNRFQPRLAFDDTSIKELASSIKEHGIIQPLVVRRVNDKYEIIAGERRFRAAKEVGLLSVPAIMSNLNDDESAEVAIVENVQRKDLTAIEEAKSYKALLDKGLMSQEDLARKMGLSQASISNKLRLLSLTAEIQEAILNEKISERHARSLLKLKTSELQNKFLEKVISERLTVKMLEEAIKKELGEETKIEEIKEVVPEKKEDTIMNTPINLTGFGEKPSNKFFSFTEDTPVNMEMKPKKELIPTEEIEMLDDFKPEIKKSQLDEIKEFLKKYPNIITNEIPIGNNIILTLKIPND